MVDPKEICHGCKLPQDDGKTLQVCSRCHWARYHDSECQKEDWPRHKSLCQILAKELQDLVTQAERVRARVEQGLSKLAGIGGAGIKHEVADAIPPLPIKNEPLADAKLQIMLLRLAAEDMPFFEDIAASFIQALQNVAEVRTATRLPEASRLLAEVSAVFVADAAILDKENLSLLTSLVDFVKVGGRVIIGGLFPTFVRFTELDSFLANIWQLPWKSGDYTRETFRVNTALKVPLPNIPKSYSMKALHFNKVKFDQRVYLRNHSGQTPAAITSIGKGVMGYIGDVNMEQETTAVILAMLGLGTP